MIFHFVVLTLTVINNILITTAQMKHDIIIERAVKVYVDKNIADFNVSVAKINRKDTAISVYIDLYKDIYAFIMVNVQLYAMFSNEYRLMPVTIHKTACDFMDNEWQWVADEIRKTGNFPKRCPIPVGFYYVKNYVLDSRKIPDMPWDKIMLWGNVTDKKDNLIASIKFFVRYDRDGIFLRKLGLK